MSRRLAATLVAVSALSPFRPLAAELPEPPSSEDGWVEIGPFHLKPGFEIKNVGYESNIFLSDEDPVGDTTFTLAPALDAVVLFGHDGRLDIHQGVDIVRFLSTSSQNHVDSETTVGWQLLFSDFSYEGGAEFETARLRPSDEITERIRLDRTGLDGEIAWARTERAEIFTGIAAESYDYRDDPSAAGTVSDLNRDEYVYTVGARYRFRPKTDLFLEVRREDYRFDDAGLGRNVRGWRYVPGVAFDDTAFVQGKLHLGYLDFQPLTEGRAAYDGPVLDATLSKGFGRRVRVTLRAERDVVFSIFGDNLFFVSKTAEVEAHTSVSSRFRVEIGGTLARNSYPVPLSSPTFSGRRLDELRSVRLGGSYRISGAPRLGLSVQYRERDSNFDAADFDEIRLLGNATYTF